MDFDVANCQIYSLVLFVLTWLSIQLESSLSAFRIFLSFSSILLQKMHTCMYMYEIMHLAFFTCVSFL